MSCELNLRFPNNNQVVVKFDEQETEKIDFVSPLNEEDLQDIRWYLETYAAQYTTDVDDERANRIAAKLPRWGEDLFDAVFNSRAAGRIFNDFQDEEEEGKLLTISASHPAILSLPWELLRDSEGTYLLHDNPRISVRRRLAGAGGGRRAFKVKTKEKLRLLFVVSRPSGAGFIDPRGEAQAVIKAIEQEAAGCVEVEFLRPATLDNLVERLEDKRQPKVDIVHFDGHGVFDVNGNLQAQAKYSDPGLTKGERKAGANTGYLLFEDKEGESALITAETLGDMLNRQQVALMVSSACQSATVAGEDAMGSVAARLTHAGIPTVLAMTHSVLVSTTQQLFAKFYQRLVRGESMGEALDNARRDLYLNQSRGERQRGTDRITLKLQDWFLPALYQSGKDKPLLNSSLPVSSSPHPPVFPNNLPPLQEAGFFGRSWELWQIEKAFIQVTRRITISGFGGQGKTYLATEAGRWLGKTGMFSAVCFVDYAAFQGVDGVGLAVSTLGTVLNTSFIDADAVTKYLKENHHSPLLLILDNLESLATESCNELLTVAKQWSEIGNCRLLITTRAGDLNHPDYSNQGSRKHIALPLSGLGKEDALQYFQERIKMPPAPQLAIPSRDVLLELFKLVNYHPLSINLLSQQLKMRRPAELGQRLEALVAETPNNPLLASLNLSLERLDTEAQQLLPKLGVFQGGAMEPDLLAITEFSNSQWQSLRPALENTGLIQVENIPGVTFPFIKFHPTLAPALWLRLKEGEQNLLLVSHRRRYYQLSHNLYFEDRKYPQQVRAITKRELPNLLFAVYGALKVNEEWAVDFVDNVSIFLMYFGFSRYWAILNQQLKQVSESACNSERFLLFSNLGAQMFNLGRYGEAAEIFTEILKSLGEYPNFSLSFTLLELGRCLKYQGKVAQATQLYLRGLAINTKLEETEDVKRQRSILLTNLGIVLADTGNYQEARSAYKSALALIQQIDGDIRGEASVNGQLGYLEMVQGHLVEAESSYQKALHIFRQLNEPAQEAVSWYQLGMVYKQMKKWDLAENAYRQSTRIEEAQGNLARASRSWDQLAIVNACVGKIEEATAWLGKAIEGAKATGDQLQVSMSLSNLATLLQNQPNRLMEARQLAEEALTLDKTLDPSATQIWKTYETLSQITKKQGETTKAEEYRCLARQTKAAFAGTKYELKDYGWLIIQVVATADHPDVRSQLEISLEEGIKAGWDNLVAAIRRIVKGERDEKVLWKGLDMEESMIISAILQGIADPSTLEFYKQ